MRRHADASHPEPAGILHGRRGIPVFDAISGAPMPRFFKADRLTRQSEFAAVRDRGVSARGGCLLVALLPGVRRRLGLAVSSRVGPAVVRNRVKRVVREFFRCHPDSFPVGDCVVIPRQGAGALANEELRNQLARALARLSEELSAKGRTA